MKCVDLKLNPAPQPPDLDDFKNQEFVCANCLKTVPAKSEELFFLPDFDYFFHRHPDRSFYRALLLTEDGNIRIAAGDSVDENVLQSLGIYLDGAGGYKMRFASVDDLRNAAKKFFQAMRAQKRGFVQRTYHLGPDGTMRIT